MNIIDQWNWRYAVKKFDPNWIVSDDKIEIIKEAFRLTASSFWLQPWKLFILRDKNKREKLLEYSWNQRQVVDASDLLILARPTTIDETTIDTFINDIAFKRSQKREDLQWYKDMLQSFISGLTEEQKVIWSENQIYIALGNLLNVCSQMHIDTCAMEGFSKSDYDRILWLDIKWYSSVVLLPIWYRSPDDKYAFLNKVRFSVDEVTESL